MSEVDSSKAPMHTKVDWHLWKIVIMVIGDDDDWEGGDVDVGGDADDDNHQQQVITEYVNIPSPASNTLMPNLTDDG